MTMYEIVMESDIDKAYELANKLSELGYVISVKKVGV
jgi:hypothetical protein